MSAPVTPRGLPGPLPAGERILWQGQPRWQSLARSAFALHWISGYFALLALAAALSGSTAGAGLTGLAGVLCALLVIAIARAAAASSIYTLTDARLVLQIGMAFRKHVNLPLPLVAAADLDRHADGTGNIALQMAAPVGAPYLMLWPHARPWRLREPQPMLRAVPNADRVAAILARACARHGPVSRAASPLAVPHPGPAITGAAA